MGQHLKIKFDSEQQYQLDAINSVVKLFEGVPTLDNVDFWPTHIDDKIVTNAGLDEQLDYHLLLHNLQQVQQKNNLEKRGSEISLSSKIELDEGPLLNGIHHDKPIAIPHFTIEMETGTGKTYVYLRTIHELHKIYGYKKFMIVVPSIAIYEGVVKTIEMTKSHFASLYDNEEISLIQYDGAKLGKLREYAETPYLSVMIMTMDSFNKPSNNFYKMTEQLQGDKKPIHFVQETRPIVVLDEPQNFHTKIAKEAIRTLKPLFVLRYSATHKETPNLCYRLTPIDAFRNNLVKQIEVIGISDLDNFNVPLIRLMDIVRQPIAAKVKVNVLDKGIKKERDILLRQGSDLEKITGLQDYAGLKVTEIQYGKKDEHKKVSFENGFELSFHHALASKESIFRAQIEKTIEVHMAKQEELKEKGIKVLSLFFIDKVKNYTGKEALIRRLFDECFNRLKTKFPSFSNMEPSEVREGYFAKPGKTASDDEAVDTNGRNQTERKMEKAAFELIMKKKEQLLSFEEPVSFIFAHSALREGWDNPNVFQICTLNQTVSNIKKRQEIGRGLRLAVDQKGERPAEYEMNILTVIANESYENYVASLQHEYEEDGNKPPQKPKKPRQAIVKRNDRLFLSSEFQHFWAKLNQKVKYEINIDTEKLINQCVKRLNATKFPEPTMEISRAKFIMHQYKIVLRETRDEKAYITIAFQNSTGNRYTRNETVREGDSLYKLVNDIRLKHHIVTEINSSSKSEEQSLIFAGGEILTKESPFIFHTEKIRHIEKNKTRVFSEKYPIPNLIERAAKETNLTKKTIITIFKKMDLEKRKLIWKNPEGWIREFLSRIQEVSRNHIAENIEFTVMAEPLYDVNAIFPITRKCPQKQLIAGGINSLYDKVQVDSDVERDFMLKRVIPDADNTKLYFKFPPHFKIKFPKVIGNYKPGWGMVRLEKEGEVKLEFIRDLKGGLNSSQVKCAQKYFGKLGISYGVVDQTVRDWWEKSRIE
ncbi:type III restriction enzyme [Bacillus thermophilus]|uniref:Type III restriction enzyme n=1 Tax=Siminovitchia thermophila TaxID=1245522 RepID=A0ABS2R1N5_9BACI|nr:DEAD/DEAH box helicase family protein [Siminovitchia thermophila]MBM7713049.1 type III restriction enzyme [Siminovitchia thermophila]ONK25110.1 type III restriction endonuclease subunit R [Bacillus sp. VT-16-64]